MGIAALAVAALLCPLPARTQQITSSVQDPSDDINTLASGAKALAQAMKPVSPNPFERPSSGKHKVGDDNEGPDSLLFQMDRKFTSTLTEYAFTAPTGFYSLEHNQGDPADWNSSLTSAFTAYLNQGSATAVRMTGDLETFGQRRLAGGVGDPGTQIFTVQWEATHVVPSKLGAMEVAAGRYQQQLTSYPAFANGPLTDVLLGYSASSVGFETTVTLPDRNLGLSFRSGTERVGSMVNKAHTALFEFSWTW
jgi:hypothetical protein